MQARLCASVHTGLRVVLHKTERPHLLVLKLDQMVVAQMSLLGLSQFIDMSTVPTRQIPLATPESEDASNNEDDPRSTEGGDASQETQPWVVNPYMPYVQWSDVTGSSRGGSAFVRVGWQHSAVWTPCL